MWPVVARVQQVSVRDDSLAISCIIRPVWHLDAHTARQADGHQQEVHRRGAESWHHFVEVQIASGYDRGTMEQVRYHAW